MSWKKNWFGCMIWAFYSMVLCVVLATYMNVQCVVWKIGKYGTVSIVCVAFLGIFGIYWLLCAGASKWGHVFRNMGIHTKALWELFLVLSIFAGAVLTRFYWYRHSFAGDGITKFYEMAVVREEGGIPFIRHGASYLYTGVLSALFSFLGNKQIAGIGFQTVCQLAGILLLYFGIKNLAGTMAAVIASAMVSFLPAMFSFNFMLTPESLYFFLFAGMLFLISYYRKSAEKRKTFFCRMGPILLGAGIGYVTYLDITGVLLFLLLLYGLLSIKGGAKETAGNITVSFLGFCFAFLLLLWLGCLSVKEPLLQALLSWWQLYVPFLPGSGKTVMPDVTIAGNILVCMLSAGYVVGFWFQDRDRGRGFILSMFALAAFVSGGKPNMDYQILVTLYGAVLAGIGAASAIVEEKTEPISDSAAYHDAQNGKTMEMDKKEIGKIPDLAVEETEPEEKPGKIRFIENPLPLPKKHKKKTMGYRFEPEEDRMRYDIEVKDGDDFDLK